MSKAHSGENNHLYGITGVAHPAFGIKHSEESRQIRSQKLKGKPGLKGEKNPRYGVPHTPQTKQLLSDLAKQRTGKKNPFFGKHHSEETRAKMKVAWEIRRAKNNSTEPLDKPKVVL